MSEAKQKARQAAAKAAAEILQKDKQSALAAYNAGRDNGRDYFVETAKAAALWQDDGSVETPAVPFAYPLTGGSCDNGAPHSGGLAADLVKACMALEETGQRAFGACDGDEEEVNHYPPGAPAEFAFYALQTARKAKALFNNAAVIAAAFESMAARQYKDNGGGKVIPMPTLASAANNATMRAAARGLIAAMQGKAD